MTTATLTKGITENPSKLWYSNFAPDSIRFGWQDSHQWGFDHAQTTLELGERVARHMGWENRPRHRMIVTTKAGTTVFSN